MIAESKPWSRVGCLPIPWSMNWWAHCLVKLRIRSFRPHRRRPYPRNLATREPMEDECGWCNRKSRRFRAKARPLLAF